MSNTANSSSDINSGELDANIRALYLSKAESSSKWAIALAFIFAPAGIVLALMTNGTVRKVQKYYPKEVRRIWSTNIAAIIIAIAVVVVTNWYFVGLINRLSNQLETDLRNPASYGYTTETSAPDTNDRTELKVGETMHFSTQDITVLDASLRSSITRTYGEYVTDTTNAGENAVFLVVHLEVMNTTQASFDYGDLVLWGSDGTTYDAYNAIGEIDDYIDVRTLQPKITETGYAVYRVPKGENKFFIGGTVIETGDVLVTKLVTD